MSRAPLRIRPPLIVAGPGVNHHGDISDAVLHASGIVPTLIEIAGAQDSSMLAGSNLAPLQGISMLPVLSGKAEHIRSESDWLGWELFGNRAVRQGDWKLRYLLKETGGTATGNCSTCATTEVIDAAERLRFASRMRSHRGSPP
jgi:arylsulfatase A-like enzyme